MAHCVGYARIHPKTVKQFQSNLLMIFYFCWIYCIFLGYSPIDQRTGDDMHSTLLASKHRCWNWLKRPHLKHALHVQCAFISKRNPIHKVGLGTYIRMYTDWFAHADPLKNDNFRKADGKITTHMMMLNINKIQCKHKMRLCNREYCGIIGTGMNSKVKFN